MSLREFNEEEGVFVDANIFIYHLDKSSPYNRASTDFLTKIECQQTKAFTSTLVLDEIIYCCLLLRGSEMHPELSMNALKKRMAGNKEFIQECYKFIEEVFHYIEMIRIIGNLTVLEINFEVVKYALPIAKEYGLLPRDAIHLATCQMFGIKYIATNDAHFQKIPFLTALTP